MQALIHLCTFGNVISGGSIRAGIAVTTLRTLSEPLALIMTLAMCAVAKADLELSPAAARFGTFAPVTPLAPAICRHKHNRKHKRRSARVGEFATSKNERTQSISTAGVAVDRVAQWWKCSLPTNMPRVRISDLV